ncbi:Hypothetical protein GLP15_3939 [Giardia lamblia P15]|uniref:Uncharacterized protein n=1 Tax=Giardia intestinalis (strain P15) TaxID=658858 RepID=E1F2H0_GIAIA|nr:Hypothetical protein GLP15_3939 [Giardia lamblia P15]
MSVTDEEQELELLREMLRTKKAYGSIYPARLKELSARELYDLAKIDESLFEIKQPPPLEIHTATHDTAVIADLLQSMSSYPRIRDIAFPTSSASIMSFLLSDNQHTSAPSDAPNGNQRTDTVGCTQESAGI